MLKLLHKYVRRFIRWVNTPSEEERYVVTEASYADAVKRLQRKRWIALAADSLGSQKVHHGRYIGLTPEEADEWISCFRAAVDAGAPAHFLNFHIEQIKKYSQYRVVKNAI